MYINRKEVIATADGVEHASVEAARYHVTWLLSAYIRNKITKANGYSIDLALREAIVAELVGTIAHAECLADELNEALYGENPRLTIPSSSDSEAGL